METYCVSCKRNTAKKNLSVTRIKQSRSMLLSNCVVYWLKKSSFIKNQELHQVVFNSFNNFELISLK